MTAKWIDKANIHLVSDGSLAGTHIYFVGVDGKEQEILPVTSVSWFSDIEYGDGKARLCVSLAPVDVIMPIELVEFVKEAPELKIMEWLPWYSRIWRWLRRTA